MQACIGAEGRGEHGHSKELVLRWHSAHFFGVIAPNMPDRTPIRLMVRKAGQVRWTNVVPYVRTFGGYHWSFYYHPITRGTYYFKVQYAATATYLGSTSRTVTVVWK